MIEGLKPYAAYRELGLPWLEKVPAHWEMRRTKVLFRERVQKGFPAEPLLAATQSHGVIRKDAYASRTVTAQKDLHLLKLVETGDFVISLRSFEGGLEVAHCRGIISPAYTVLEPKDGTTRDYFRYFFKSRDFVSSLTLFVTGIREGQNIDYERLSRSFLPVPPPEDRTAIVRFLDHATRRLDKAIRAKRKTIALLNEQKHSIVDQAVTRGLDGSARVRNSGVEWIGRVPHHWGVKRIKCILREVDLRSNSESEVLLSVRMHHGVVRFADHFDHPPQAASLVGFKILSPGQLVVNRMQAGNGVIYSSSLRGVVSPDYAVFDPIGDVNIEYLGALFRSRTYRAKFRAESKGLGTGTSGFMRLYSDRMGAIHVALPSRVEQDAILKALEDRLSHINETVARIEREASLLREFRVRLIADVVTGQLDVRAAVACLPTEPVIEEDSVDDGDLDDATTDDLAELEADA